MHAPRLLIAAVLSVGAATSMVLGEPGASGASLAPRIGAPVPFTLHGKITKVEPTKNVVVVLSGKKRYDLVTSSTTVVTIDAQRSTVKKLKVGETAHVTGEKLGSLYITLTVRA